MSWWEKEPLRIFEIAEAFVDLGTKDAIRTAEDIDKVGANAQHMHCMMQAGGLDDRKLFFDTSIAKAVKRDYLKEYLPEAHQRGIKVIVYFNVHWYTKEFGKEHPDWLQIKEDSHPIDDVYTTGTSFCVNSRWREWVFQIIRDLGKYDIDGIFFDGPIFFADTCYCQCCQDLFQNKYNYPLPLKSKRANSCWKDLIEFQSDSIARFLKDSRQILREVCPSALLYMNGNSYWPSWPTGRDNRKIIPHTDMLGAEGGFLHGDLSLTPIYKPGITAKLLEIQSQGKPTVIFDCAGHKPWSFYLLPEAEISLLYTQTIANGANVWLSVLPDDLGQVQMEVVKRYNSFIKRNADVYLGTKSIARIGLLWPSRSANFYSGSSVPLTDFTTEMKPEGIGDVSHEFNGFYEALARGHLPFDVIDEEQLDIEGSRLKTSYDLIILPNAACLSKEDTESIERFVESGGNIIATFETSLYDKYGKRLPDFQLSRVLGIHFADQIFGPMDWDYIAGKTSEDNNFGLLDGITKKYIPAPHYGIKVDILGAEKIISYYERLKGCYDGIPALSNNPFLLVNTCGKGKALYLAGTFGETLYKFRFPEYYQLVCNIGNLLTQRLIKLENAPSSLEVTLRKKENKLFIHLINFTSEMKRPIERIIPI
ncbi:MAG TPA: hypothetical protein EYP78_06355, partial [Candidatus Omnitrophica bacterium]|nr:hypothetical protein [Candidatus Omnitrophota bacterium]